MFFALYVFCDIVGFFLPLFCVSGLFCVPFPKLIKCHYWASAGLAMKVFEPGTRYRPSFQQIKPWNSESNLLCFGAFSSAFDWPGLLHGWYVGEKVRPCGNVPLTGARPAWAEARWDTRLIKLPKRRAALWWLLRPLGRSSEIRHTLLLLCSPSIRAATDANRPHEYANGTEANLGRHLSFRGEKITGMQSQEPRHTCLSVSECSEELRLWRTGVVSFV